MFEEIFDITGGGKHVSAVSYSEFNQECRKVDETVLPVEDEIESLKDREWMVQTRRIVETGMR